MTLSKISECSSETDSFFQTVLKTNKNRVIDRTLLTRKQHLRLLCLPNPTPKQPPLPKRKIKRCHIPQICPERIDQLSIPKSVYILDVLEKYNQRLDPDRVVRLVKLVHAEKENDKPRCKTKKKKGKKKRKGKKQSIEDCIRIWLKMRIELTTKLIMKRIKEQDNNTNKLTPNYRQLLIALGLMRSLRVKKKATMRYTKKYLMDICEQLAIEVDNECKPYGLQIEPLEIKELKEPEEEEEKRHVVWVMSNPPSDESEEEEEEEEEVEEEASEEEEGEEITAALKELDMLGEEEEIPTKLPPVIMEEGESGEEEEAAPEEFGEGDEVVAAEEAPEVPEAAEVEEKAGEEGEEKADEEVEEKAGEEVEGEEELEGEEKAGEISPEEVMAEESLAVSEIGIAEELEGLAAYEELPEGLLEEEEKVEVVEEPPLKAGMEFVTIHPENSISYTSWKIYSSWLDEFSNNIAVYGKCLRNFRDILQAKNVLYSDREKIQTILINWSTYLSDSLAFETQISATFQGKPVTKCPQCADYTLYDLPIDHELPQELEDAAQSTAKWSQLLCEAEMLCRSFLVDEVSVMSHETIEIIDTTESIKSSEVSEYSFDFVQADDYVIPPDDVVDLNKPPGKPAKGGKGGGGAAAKGGKGKKGKGKK